MELARDDLKKGMVAVQVNFYGIYRLLVGGKTVEISIASNATLIDLLQAITIQFPSLRNEIFDARGNLFAYIPLFINGRNPRLLAAGVHTVIRPLDVLSIFSPISSGRINVEEINQNRSSE